MAEEILRKIEAIENKWSGQFAPDDVIRKLDSLYCELQQLTDGAYQGGSR